MCFQEQWAHSRLHWDSLLKYLKGFYAQTSKLSGSPANVCTWFAGSAVCSWICFILLLSQETLHLRPELQWIKFTCWGSRCTMRKVVINNAIHFLCNVAWIRMSVEILNHPGHNYLSKIYVSTGLVFSLEGFFSSKLNEAELENLALVDH